MTHTLAPRTGSNPAHVTARRAHRRPITSPAAIIAAKLEH